MTTAIPTVAIWAHQRRMTLTIRAAFGLVAAAMLAEIITSALTFGR